jgi:Ssp1 endopeptidase immunity protein Rap1a
MRRSRWLSILNGINLTVAMLLTYNLRPAIAEFYDGNQLQSWCQLKDKALIKAYVAGVYDDTQGYTRVMEPIRDILNTHAILDHDQEAKDTLKAATQPISGCPATSITLDQMVHSVCIYLSKNPRQRPLGGTGLVTTALAESFPCHK